MIELVEGICDKYGLTKDPLLKTIGITTRKLSIELYKFKKPDISPIINNINFLIYKLPMMVIMEYGLFETLQDYYEYIVLAFYGNSDKSIKLLGSSEDILMLFYETDIPVSEVTSNKDLHYCVGFKSKDFIFEKTRRFIKKVVENAYMLLLCHQNMLTVEDILVILYCKRKVDNYSFSIKFSTLFKLIIMETIDGVGEKSKTSLEINLFKQLRII